MSGESSAGLDTRQPPAAQGAQIRPPVEPRTAALPFDDPLFAWEQFESLCRDLLTSVHGAPARRNGTSGQRQHGVDVYALLPDGRCVACQSRRETRIAQGELAAAVDDFLRGPWAARSAAFVFATTASLRRTELAEELAEQTMRAAASGVDLHCWDGETIAALLRTRPAIVETYFGAEWRGAFCAVDDRLERPLSPLVLAGMTRDEVEPRPWLSSLVDGFIADQASGYVVIEGLPGSGKTTFLASLADERSWPFHTVQWGVTGEAATRAALRSLADSICQSRPELRDLRPSAEFAGDWPVAFNGLLRGASDRLGPGERLVLAIDALPVDDVIAGGATLGLPSRLPRGVFIVASQLPGRTVFGDDEKRLVVVLERERALVDADLAQFAQRKLAEAEGRRQGRDADVSGVVREVVSRADGDWLYLRYVLEDLAAGGPTGEAAPSGLDQYYLNHWHRAEMADPAVFREMLLPAMAVLTAAQEPLSLRTIAAFAGVEPTPVDRSASWRYLHRFLRETDDPEPRYAFHHDSHRVFLRSSEPGAAAGSRQLSSDVSLRRRLARATLLGDAMISDALAEAAGGFARLPELAELRARFDGYGLRHFGTHLRRAGRAEQLRRLVSSGDADRAAGSSGNRWYDIQAAEASWATYARDVDLATEGRGDAPTSILPAALIRSSLRSLAAGYAPDLVAYAAESGAWSPAKCLDAALAIPGRRMRVEALERILPFLPVELRAIASDATDAALAEGAAGRSAADRTRAGGGVRPHAGHPGRRRAANEAADALRTARGQPPSSAAVDRFLAALRHLGTDEVSALLREAAPHLPPTAVMAALQTASRVNDSPSRARVLLGCLPFVDDARRGRIVSTLVGLVGEAADAPDLPLLAGATAAWITDTPTLGSLAEAVGGIDNEADRRSARLSMLGQASPSLLGNIPITSFATSERDTDIALAYLRTTGVCEPIPTTLPRPLRFMAHTERVRQQATAPSEGEIARLFEDARAQRAVHAAIGLAGLAPRLDHEWRTRFGRWIADADDDTRPAALQVFAESCPGETLEALDARPGTVGEAAMGRILCGAARGGLEAAEVLRRALELRDERARAQVLICLAGTTERDLLSRLDSAADGLADRDLGSSVHAALVRSVPRQWLDRELGRCEGTGDQVIRSRFVRALVSRQPVPQPERIAALVETLEPADRRDAFAELLRHLPAEQGATLLLACEWAKEDLSVVVEALPRGVPEALAKQIWALADVLEPRWRRRVQLSLARDLRSVDREALHRRVAEEAMRDDDLAPLLLGWPSFTRSAWLPWWGGLPSRSTSTRDVLLDELGALIGVLSSDDAASACVIADAVIDVGAWWP